LSIDEEAARELDITMESESALHRQFMSVVEMLKKRVEKGTYDPALAWKAWMFWYEAGARAYASEYGPYAHGGGLHLLRFPAVGLGLGARRGAPRATRAANVTARALVGKTIRVIKEIKKAGLVIGVGTSLRVALNQGTWLWLDDPVTGVRVANRVRLEHVEEIK
jgi:hypothetical protein